MNHLKPHIFPSIYFTRMLRFPPCKCDITGSTADWQHLGNFQVLGQRPIALHADGRPQRVTVALAWVSNVLWFDYEIISKACDAIKLGLNVQINIEYA